MLHTYIQTIPHTATLNASLPSHPLPSQHYPLTFFPSLPNPFSLPSTTAITASHAIQQRTMPSPGLRPAFETDGWGGSVQGEGVGWLVRAGYYRAAI